MPIKRAISGVASATCVGTPLGSGGAQNQSQSTFSATSGRAAICSASSAGAYGTLSASHARISSWFSRTRSSS